MPDEIFDIDLDELIDILPDDEVDALLRDLDLGDFEKEKTEDADLVKHGDNDRVDPAKSRAAKKRYQQNRETYRKAFDKFRRSSRGKLFYNKLSRFSQRPSSVMKRETESVDTLIDKVLSGANPASVILMNESVALPSGRFRIKTKPTKDKNSNDDIPELEVMIIPPGDINNKSSMYNIMMNGKQKGTITKDILQKNLDNGFYTIIK